MSWQLIYTSAPRGLLSGQSGFCTVARSADLREALVQRLEQISSYHYLRVAEAATAKRNPAISAFRLLDLRGAKYYVLTRILPCGLDFTARTNHLAHHLVFQPDELAELPSPAAILRRWPGWMASWQGEPRLLAQLDPAELAAARKTFLPAQTWARLTGDGGRAAGLLESECVRGCYLLCPPGSEDQLLEMYCETLELLNFNGQFPLRPWRHPFTSFLQAEDNPNDFQWRGCQENTPAYKQALTRSAPIIALRSVRVPGNSLVKLARETPKPPPAAEPFPKVAPKPAPSGSSSMSALKTLAREPYGRGAFIPPTLHSVNINKPARAAKPAFLDLDFTVNSATLTRLGIFVAVLVVLLVAQSLIKHHPATRPVEQGIPAPKPSSPLPPAPEPPLKKSPPAAVAPEARPLDRLKGDGPTFVLMVPNPNSFSLPIESISSFQNLLHRYDRSDPGALPGDIRVEVTTDHWDFASGSLMKVEGRNGQKGRQFSASLGATECVFDYSELMEEKGKSLAVQANFDRAPGAYAMHFGFSAPTNGDPFRLLILNAKNPPAPLRLAGQFLPEFLRDLAAPQPAALRLIPDFHLLAGQQWQLQPLLRTESHPAESQYLYKNWPSNDMPAAGHALDFADARQLLRAHREQLEGKRHSLSEYLRLPLGKRFGFDDPNLASFLSFSRRNLTRSRFLEYLDNLKDNAPEKSFIKKWHNQTDPDHPGDVAGKFQRLYDLWCDKRPEDRSWLTITNAEGPTNYFITAWQVLGEMELSQNQLDQLKMRFDELDRAYIALCIVDPRQPGPGLEMIRFNGP
jgi:hypothetical protein